MKKLLNDIRTANEAYAKGIPIMTDTEYDKLWQQLYNTDPTNNLLYHTSRDPNLGGDSIIHLQQIMGTQKAFSMEDLKPFLQRFGNKHLVLEPKYDGVAAMIYNSPNGRQLVLHGDGVKGKDISHHLMNITAPIFSGPKESVELLIPFKYWESSYGKNPRNTVAGWMNRSEADYPPYTVVAISHINPILYMELIPPYNLDELHDAFLSYYNDWSSLYPMDGLMIKLIDEEDRLIASHNGTVSLWSVAWKPPISTAETIVTDIHWNVSRNGRVIPTIEYEPVELCGTTNTMVTGNNAQWVHEHSIKVGTKITIGKAGEIIPKIISVTSNYGIDPRPAKCPECDSFIEWQGVHLVCNAPNCLAQLTKSLAYFYSDKGMEIKSIGEKMIFKLLQNSTLKTQLTKRPWLLLEPKAYLSLIIEIWGTKHTIKYQENLTKLSNSVNHAHFIAALGYDSLAYKSALKCWQMISGHAIRGNVPRKAISSFTQALFQLNEAKRDLTTFKFLPVPGLPDKTYCITGTLSMDRNDMITYLSQHNWQFSNQVSKHTDYLILGDISHETTKIRKATELNVSVIKEQDIKLLLDKGD